MLLISPQVREKLKRKHCVSEAEVLECFASREGALLMDTRENHKTDPPTLWFISETNMGRLLKIVFIESVNDIIVKTAYQPNSTEIRIYNKYGKPSQGNQEDNT